MVNLVGNNGVRYFDRECVGKSPTFLEVNSPEGNKGIPTKPSKEQAARIPFILMLAMIGAHLAMRRFLTIEGCLFPISSLFIVFTGPVTQTTTSENEKTEGTMYSK